MLRTGDYVKIAHGHVQLWGPRVGIEMPDGVVAAGPLEDGSYRILIDRDVIYVMINGQPYKGGEHVWLHELDLPPTLLNTRVLEEWLDA